MLATAGPRDPGRLVFYPASGGELAPDTILGNGLSFLQSAYPSYPDRRMTAALDAAYGRNTTVGRQAERQASFRAAHVRPPGLSEGWTRLFVVGIERCGRGSGFIRLIRIGGWGALHDSAGDRGLGHADRGAGGPRRGALLLRRLAPSSASRAGVRHDRPHGARLPGHRA